MLAFKLLTRASEAGEVGANVTLAHCYEFGIGELHSPTKAVKLMNLAYERNV